MSFFPASQRDAELAVTYANQAAIALENSRLYSELQVELSLKQNLIDELENKNADLERFTYTVSHDLRYPLVTIRGFLGYLERDALQGNMESFRKDLERISRATVRMDNLLKDVLELSRIGRLVNEPQDVPFDDLVKDALEIVHGRLEERGITLRIVPPLGTQPDLPLVHGDRPRLPIGLSAQVGTTARGKPIFRQIMVPNKWSDVQKTLLKKISGIYEVQDGPANCLDTIKGSQVYKAYKYLDPKGPIRYKTTAEYGNKLIGHLLTLKFNIAMSAHGHTPSMGFGELIFTEITGSQP